MTCNKTSVVIGTKQWRQQSACKCINCLKAHEILLHLDSNLPWEDRFNFLLTK